MKIDVKKIAELASLNLSPDEEKKLGDQLEKTIFYIESLNEIDTKGIEPTSQVTNLTSVKRKDKSAPSLTQDEALSNTKSKENGLFKVKAVIK